MKIVIIIFMVISVSFGTEQGVKDCLKNPIFQRSILKSFTGKFMGVNFWRNDSTITDQLSHFLSNGNGNINEFNLILAELLDKKREKLYKTKYLATKLLYLNEIASFVSQWFGKYEDEDGKLISEEIINERSTKFLEWLMKNIKLFKSWIDVNYEAVVLDVSDNGKEEVTRIRKCLEKYSDEDFEDNFDWLPCFYVCRDLRNISIEIESTFQSIPECHDNEWLGDLIIRTFMDFMQLGHCYFDIISPKHIPTIKEGDTENHLIEFQTYVTPGVHCFQKNIFNRKKKLVKEMINRVFRLTDYCKVRIEMSTSNFLKDMLPLQSPEASSPIGTPKCKDGSSIVQVAMGFHADGINNSSGDVEITKQNWNKTFIVPIFAVIDHKIDEMANINFTIKMVADGKRLNTTKIALKVVDGDSKGLAVCQSINDPHLVTFDNVYYNNLEQGYFVLYKNNELPYEVQVIYQSCGPSTKGESCNCAVAVKSYDDVFVVDRCRTRQSNSSMSDQYLRFMKVTLFLNGELANGTRIFRKHDGLTYQVLLPHGTLVTIKTNSLNFINVWITPSPYDRNRTSGLCGTYNDILEDDLQHFDGSFSSTKKVRKFPPRDFISSWRVKPSDRFFEGVSEESESESSNSLVEACRCSHGFIKNISCKCGFDQLVESCNFDLGDEFLTSNISLIAKKSKNLSHHDNDTIVDNRDIDDSFRSALNFTGINVPQRKYCSSLLMSESKLIPACFALLSFKESDYSRGPIGNAIEGCIDDMRITGNVKELDLEWKLSALDAAMETCSLFMSRDPKYFLLGGIIKNKFENETCANLCHKRGDCITNSCSCYPGYHGPDCAFNLTEDYTPIVFHENIFCDSRFENCSNARFFGMNFSEEVQFTCTARPIKATVLDKIESTIVNVMSTYTISPNQAVCILPKNPRKFQNSHEITLKADINLSRRNILLSTFQIIVFDSACMICDHVTEKCTLKDTKDYCLVDQTCYEDFEPHIENHCLICNVSLSATELTNSQDMNCITGRQMHEDKVLKERKELIIRLIASSTFSIFIILVTIIMFVKDKKQQRSTILKQEDENKEEEENDLTNEIISVNKTPKNSFSARIIDDEARGNKKWNSLIIESSANEKIPEEEKIRSMSFNVVTQVRRRRRTFSEISEKSLGIGGGGSILYGCQGRLSYMLPYDESTIGGHGGNFYAAPSTKSLKCDSRVENRK